MHIWISPNTVITWSNITWYFLQHCSDWYRTQSEVELTKDIPHFTLASYGVSFVRIWGKIDLVITAPHCTHNRQLTHSSTLRLRYIDGILLKGPSPPCLRMADRALLAGYSRYVGHLFVSAKKLRLYSLWVIADRLKTIIIDIPNLHCIQFW